jgi:hypothetical protein
MGPAIDSSAATASRAKSEPPMNPVYVSAFAALAGSLIGGLTTFATAWWRVARWISCGNLAMLAVKNFRG